MSAELKVTPGDWTNEKVVNDIDIFGRDPERGPHAIQRVGIVYGRTEEEKIANAHLLAASKKLYEVAAFYADPANFIIIDGSLYEYAEGNDDLVRYAPIGTKARNAMALARGETP